MKLTLIENDTQLLQVEVVPKLSLDKHLSMKHVNCEIPGCRIKYRRLCLIFVDLFATVQGKMI